VHAYSDKKTPSDPTAANFIPPGKRFGSVGRGREATKGRHFLKLTMSQASFTTVPAEHRAVYGWSTLTLWRDIMISQAVF